MFDDDQNGSMDFAEYMIAMDSTKCETPEDKLRWAFRVYDSNRSATIETHELRNMFGTLFKMSGKNTRGAMRYTDLILWNVKVIYLENYGSF